MPKSVLRYTVDKVRQLFGTEVCYSNFFLSRIKVSNKSLSYELNNVFILFDVVVVKTNNYIISRLTLLKLQVDSP